MYAEVLNSKKIPILLVEDSRNEAYMAQQQLYAVDDEFEICRVSRFDEAVNYLHNKKVSAVILDLGLPDFDGPCSIKKLCNDFPDLPIVVLSGRHDKNTVQSAFEYGAQEFLIKSECTGKSIRQAILGAIIRKSLK